MTKLDQTTFRRRGAGLIGHDRTRCAGGYVLFATLNGGGAVHLVDMDGTVVHRWNMALAPGRHAAILPNGNLAYNGQLPGTPHHYAAWPVWHGGQFSEVAPDGQVVWQHTDPLHHHDAQWLPNGHLLYGAMAPLSPSMRPRITGGSARHDPPDGTLWGDVVREVDRSGRIVWEWRAEEHLAPEDFPIHPIFDRYHWPMINGLWSARNDIVLMSLRTTSGVIGVDRGSGRVVLHIGPEVVAQQHTPIELENGHILVFDNGNLRSGSSTPYSRVLEIDPSNGSIVWQYTDPVRNAFFSPFMGAAQRLPNGNTHITESTTGRLFEVTPEGDIVWEYVVPFFDEHPDAPARAYVGGAQNTLFRSMRYATTDLPWLKAA
ncbi:MAG: aryl-sulfate sulfotransferase [Janthinobacterium lividum]